MSATSLTQVSLPVVAHPAASIRQVPRTGASRSKASKALPPLRLTRRGRIVLVGIPLMLLAAVLLSLAGFFTSPAKASDSVADLAPTPSVSVTVQPGDSLWAIAGYVAPDRDARDVIADIVQLNNLTGGAVLPGQQLFVPTY
ncbi:LysM peptidoglycan-binding domain-containing protein [Arthrobacter sp. Leaf141]|uniref:LysM peptidoglycan-binding domain-containing protein n=1 Tax=Arthrobacter sp. Leaf141 TaxID=1736273 RepID=UPI0009E91E54|nr:LysM peptidoglycan-binding domain-containing protein [Arthrobacter sp. Leaf141]